jgi:hypothetical protein
VGTINNLSSSYLQSLLNNLEGTSSTNSPSGSVANGIATSATGQPSDAGQLSPLAQLLSTLQQLQQSDPAQYQQVTQQIATNLQSAAQTDQTEGNTAGASQLNQLATDFTNASQSGQLPNIQDLAQAIGGHHHHHHSGSSSDSAANSSSTSTSSSGSTGQTESQFLSALFGNGAQNGSQNPLSIILNTLSSAGITSSAS